jgi:hypothetical protein
VVGCAVLALNGSRETCCLWIIAEPFGRLAPDDNAVIGGLVPGRYDGYSWRVEGTASQEDPARVHVREDGTIAVRWADSRGRCVAYLPASDDRDDGEGIFGIDCGDPLGTCVLEAFWRGARLILIGEYRFHVGGAGRWVVDVEWSDDQAGTLH